jgi:TM2 domain-containing membrane protein YozV
MTTATTASQLSHHQHYQESSLQTWTATLLHELPTLCLSIGSYLCSSFALGIYIVSMKCINGLEYFLTSYKGLLEKFHGIFESLQMSIVALLPGPIGAHVIKWPSSLFIAYCLWFSPLGIIGVHHLYLGRWKSFLLSFFTVSLFGMKWFYDGIFLKTFWNESIYNQIKLQPFREAAAKQAANALTSQSTAFSFPNKATPTRHEFENVSRKQQYTPNELNHRRTTTEARHEMPMQRHEDSKQVLGIKNQEENHKSQQANKNHIPNEPRKNEKSYNNVTFTPPTMEIPETNASPENLVVQSVPATTLSEESEISSTNVSDAESSPSTKEVDKTTNQKQHSNTNNNKRNNKQRHKNRH